MRRILVVEDSASTRSFIRSALEGSGTLGPCDIVRSRRAGSTRCGSCRAGRTTSVITDINMPDINGLELVQFIRKSDRHRSTALIIISTQSSEKDRSRGLSLGADEYLRQAAQCRHAASRRWTGCSRVRPVASG